MSLSAGMLTSQGPKSPLRGCREEEHSSLAWRTLFWSSVRFDTQAERNA